MLRTICQTRETSPDTRTASYHSRGAMPIGDDRADEVETSSKRSIQIRELPHTHSDDLSMSPVRGTPSSIEESVTVGTKRTFTKQSNASASPGMGTETRLECFGIVCVESVSKKLESRKGRSTEGKTRGEHPNCQQNQLSATKLFRLIYYPMVSPPGRESFGFSAIFTNFSSRRSHSSVLRHGSVRVVLCVIA